MGSVERKYRYSVETSLALLATGLVPKQYWVEAFQTVVYLINRLPTNILNYISQYEKLIGRLPDYSFLQGVWQLMLSIFATMDIQYAWLSVN